MEVRQVAVRRPGRPDAEASQALGRLVLDTATAVFIEQGFAATSIERVAMAAGVGKQTIYRRHPSKERLFTAVIEDLSGVLIRSAASAATHSPDALTALRDASRAALDVATEPRTVAIYRILIGESQRFPRLVEHTTHHISEPFIEGIRRLLRLARRRGQIRRDLDLEETARALIGLLTGWALRQGLLGLPSLPAATDRRTFFDNAWKIFLKGITP